MVNELIASLIIAIVQGITEWFPVSSSGHIVLFDKLLNFNGGLLFSVAVHFGTLMAVFVYFGKEITEIIKDLFSLKFKSENGKTGIFLIIGSIPAAIVGFFAADYFETVLTSLIIVALGFAITGMFLLIASISKRKIIGLRWYHALIIGAAQAFAIIPGISRSGATITAGILIGLQEKEAMKFAFLLSAPIIFGANIITIGNQTLPPTLIWATLVSFIVGLISIHLVFRYVLTKRKNFRWFAGYCLLLALIIGFWILLT